MVYLLIPKDGRVGLYLYPRRPLQNSLNKFHSSNSRVGVELRQSTRSMQNGQQDITEILKRWSDGDRRSLDELMPLVYDELHRQAARFLRREDPGHTLQTSALLNEAYLKLVDQRSTSWESRTHFFAIAAQAMRRILLDHARRKHRDKRGGGAADFSLSAASAVGFEEPVVDLIALDEALTGLEKKDVQLCRLVELRYFGGLTLDETAAALGISPATASREWNTARAWLHRELTR
jgi:RNA polymerase sigma factor (TIGR02999 family)